LYSLDSRHVYTYLLFSLFWKSGKAPWLEIETSTFADNWGNLLKKPEHADVVFIVDGNVRVLAHRILLVAASNFWARVFAIPQEVYFFLNEILYEILIFLGDQSLRQSASLLHGIDYQYHNIISFFFVNSRKTNC
jgi:hypothetical protein